MWKEMKNDKVYLALFIANVVIYLFVGSFIVFGVVHVYRFFHEDAMTTEEWSVMMLKDHREDIEEAIADLQDRQEQGISKASVSKNEMDTLQISLSAPDSYTTEILTGNQLYERLIKKCMTITLCENSTIIFSRRGFLRGYTGFYYSSNGTEENVSGGAEWYKTGHLQGNYFWYEFGYD